MRQKLINFVEFFVMLTVFAVCDRPGIVKYVVVTLICFCFFLLGRKKQWEMESLLCVSIPTVIYLGLGNIGSLFSGVIYTETIKIILFWLLPLIFAFSVYIFCGNQIVYMIDVQFIASILIYVITKARFIIESHGSESMFAYAYGTFFVYYVYKKRWGFCTLALPLMWLAEKRIVFVAAFVAVFVQGLLWLFRNDRRLANFIWGIVTLVSNVYLWLIYSGKLQEFCYGIGINTNGRVKVFGKMTEWFGSKYLSFGNGLGIVEELLTGWSLEKFSNLHNDLLKFHIELGLIGLLLYFASFIVVFYLVEKNYGSEKMTFFTSMAVYTMILFFTDNVSIYIIFLLPLYSIYFSVLSEQNKGEESTQYDIKNC